MIWQWEGRDFDRQEFRQVFKQRDREDFGRLGNKRFPGLDETVRATIERLDFLENFLEIIRSGRRVVIGVILGGSLSYGKFYCVRRDSDIDVIVVMRNWPKSLKDFSNLLISLRFFESSSIERWQQRVDYFLNSLNTPETKYVFSQKLRVSGSSFDLSLHLMDLGTIGQYCLAGIDPLRLRDGVYVVREFRESTVRRLVICDFSGKPLARDPRENFLGDLGFLSDNEIFAVRDGRYITGQYQNVIFPALEICYDPEGILQLLVGNFRDCIKRRFAYEEGDGGNLFLIHYRNAAFNPRVVEPIWQAP
jgi:hypothetical protein